MLEGSQIALGEIDEERIPGRDGASNRLGREARLDKSETRSRMAQESEANDGIIRDEYVGIPTEDERQRIVLAGYEEMGRIRQSASDEILARAPVDGGHTQPTTGQLGDIIDPLEGVWGVVTRALRAR